MTDFKNDIFETELNFTIDESNEVDGVHVLGKLKGNFFVPNGTSRNKRFYPKQVWEKQLSKKDIQNKIKERRMFGTISHEQAINDQAILEGKVSHTMTKLEVNEKNQGYGEALILNTPAGRILNTLARAGVKLFTSSRASGTYKGKFEGMPAVNPETYQLSGFDFVLDPGFLQASPVLEEAVSDSIEQLKLEHGANEAPTNEGATMDKELVESLVKENGSLKSDLKVSLKESESLKENNQLLNDEVELLKEKLSKLSDQESVVSQYEGLGTPEDVEMALNLAKEKLLEYKELGTPSEISEALDLAKEKLEAYSELGTPELVGEALEKGKALILEYQELGTPSEISEVFDRTKEMVNESKSIKASKRVDELAEELKVSRSVVEKLYNKMDEEEVVEFVKGLEETNSFKSKYKKSSSLNEKVEDKKESRPFTEKSSTQRLFERFK